VITRSRRRERGASFQDDFIELFNRGTTTVGRQRLVVITATAGHLWSRTEPHGTIRGRYDSSRGAGRAARRRCHARRDGSIAMPPGRQGALLTSQTTITRDELPTSSSTSSLRTSRTASRGSPHGELSTRPPRCARATLHRHRQQRGRLRAGRLRRATPHHPALGVVTRLPRSRRSRGADSGSTVRSRSVTPGNPPERGCRHG